MSPQQKQIVGGVVGSVAGVAFLMLLVMLVLRWKRRAGSRALLAGRQGRSASTARGITDGGSDGHGAAMSERAGLGGVSATLAALTGKRKSETPGGEASGTGERGFYRVSGRKLPSVFLSGGDGYTDPRASVISGETDYYRGSQAFDPISGGSTHLALGSPMRPVSGVPLMRTGPGRTPIQESNPFADPPSPPGSPTLVSPTSPARPTGDHLGRSLTGNDGSRASTSRFQEKM